MFWSIEDRKVRRHERNSGDQRSAFERDRDRILYSSAFQRLAGITQIVRAGEADIFHTRQQHTIKVAQVGRRLGQFLLEAQPAIAAKRGLDPEVIEAACLAHDLGHPPFGHIGEHTLDALVRDSGDMEGFEGNAQSFRIVTKLSVRFPDNHGINLSRATLAACLKYPWYWEKSGKKAKKWSAYTSEKEDFEFARAFHDHEEKTLEAELMDWSDDVAYSVHDLEDFHRCNALPWRSVFTEKEKLINHAAKGGGDEGKLEAAYDRLDKYLNGTYSVLLEAPYEGTPYQREQLRRLTSYFIGRYINAISIEEDESAVRSVKFDEDRLNEVRILKQITRDYIIGNPTLAAQQHGQKKIITELFEAFGSGYDMELGYPSFLPVRLRYLHGLDGSVKGRWIADCIASLSESEAMGLHARLFGQVAGSVLDPIVR
ncbi:MAG: dGTP triphosphohydrolase [Erythrobacter sp.]